MISLDFFNISGYRQELDAGVTIQNPVQGPFIINQDNRTFFGIIYKHTIIQAFDIINQLFIFCIYPTSNGIRQLVHQKLSTVFVVQAVFKYFQLEYAYYANNVAFKANTFLLEYLDTLRALIMKYSTLL